MREAILRGLGFWDEDEVHGLGLCAGAGGLELGLDLVFGGRYRTVCHVEREAYVAAGLAARMEAGALPQAPIWDDLTTFDGRRWRGLVDVVAGGIPCQPASQAGKKEGVADSRWLWPHALRVVAECEPELVFFENVSGLVSGKLQVGFEAILNGLQGLGYQVAAGLFTAEEVGAPHKRERVFILGRRRGE
jgi:DNA (cytosine-5)-methyltransferase 1